MTLFFAKSNFSDETTKILFIVKVNVVMLFYEHSRTYSQNRSRNSVGDILEIFSVGDLGDIKARAFHLHHICFGPLNGWCILNCPLFSVP